MDSMKIEAFKAPRCTYRRMAGISLVFEAIWVPKPPTPAERIRRDLVFLCKIEDFWLQPDPCEATTAPEILGDPL